METPLDQFPKSVGTIFTQYQMRCCFDAGPVGDHLPKSLRLVFTVCGINDVVVQPNKP